MQPVLKYRLLRICGVEIGKGVAFASTDKSVIFLLPLLNIKGQVSYKSLKTFSLHLIKISFYQFKFLWFTF